MYRQGRARVGVYRLHNRRGDVRHVAGVRREQQWRGGRGARIVAFDKRKFKNAKHRDRAGGGNPSGRNRGGSQQHAGNGNGNQNHSGNGNGGGNQNHGSGGNNHPGNGGGNNHNGGSGGNNGHQHAGNDHGPKGGFEHHKNKWREKFAERRRRDHGNEHAHDDHGDNHDHGNNHHKGDRGGKDRGNTNVKTVVNNYVSSGSSSSSKAEKIANAIASVDISGLFQQNGGCTTCSDTEYFTASDSSTESHDEEYLCEKVFGGVYDARRTPQCQRGVVNVGPSVKDVRTGLSSECQPGLEWNDMAGRCLKPPQQ